jgi:hypothetical protein
MIKVVYKYEINIKGKEKIIYFFFILLLLLLLYEQIEGIS